MCKCAREYDACDDTCPDLFNKPDLSAECSNYAAEGLCGGSFPSDVPYKEYCATIGVPCTTSQKMCKCADENFLCDKTCPDLFNVDDVKCADYAAIGICGGEFPFDAKYEEHCPTIGMSCNRKTTDVEIHEEMCQCAQQYDACQDTCPDLFNKPNLSPECSNYAAQGICGGSFPSDVSYEKYCASIGVPCTTSQEMCVCAQKHNICDKTCPYLFKINDDDNDCANYAIDGICGSDQFPTNAKYKKQCKKVGMSCINECKDSDVWTKTLKNGQEKGCDWVAKKKNKRCGKWGDNKMGKARNSCYQACGTGPCRL